MLGAPVSSAQSPSAADHEASALRGAPSPSVPTGSPSPLDGDDEDDALALPEVVSVVEVVPPPFAVVSARNPKKAKVGFRELYRFATALDLLVLFIGFLGAVACGILMPLYTVFLGNMVGAFTIGQSSSSDGLDYEAAAGGVVSDKLTHNARWLLVLGAVSFTARLIMSFCFTTTASRQANTIRRAYVQAALSQEMAWFDGLRTGDLTTRITDVIKIQDGIGEKVGMLVQCLATFCTGWTIGFVKGWKMTLVMLATVPVLVAVVAALMSVFRGLVSKAQVFYGRAGQVAEEALGSVRTVYAFGMQRSVLGKYEENLAVAQRMGTKKGLSLAISYGALLFVLFSSYGLALWYGSTLVKNHEMDAGKVLTVYFSVTMGAMGMSQLGPITGVILEAMGVAFGVFSVIDRKSRVDHRSKDGQKPVIEGNIELRDITFCYPSRPQVEVLRKFSLRIRKGQMVALVGSSGSGKSTIVGLLERFYDVEDGYGSIVIDGVPIKDINVAYLRSQIGLVTQEPVLFAATIEQNIAHGATGPVTHEDVVEAARRANVHEFIMGLPQQYETTVGERGVQLSGGQKQRIAIARALVRKPKLLMFDEATSALDTESEKTVQAAIDEVAHDNTCIVIAHRLSTVRNADVIVAMRNGRVEEMGTHDELMAKEGLYWTLVRRQQLEAGAKHDKQEVKAASKKKEDSKKNDNMEQAEEKKQNIKTLSVLARIVRLLKPSAGFVAIGAMASTINGAIFPCVALVLSQVSGLLVKMSFLPGDSSLADEVRWWSLGFVALGLLAMVIQFSQSAFLDVSAGRLTRYVRYESFKAMLRQEIAYFDDKKNMTGALTTRLASDATMLHSITGNQLCLVIQVVGALGAGIAIGFTGSWKLALVILACVPPQALSSALHVRYMARYQRDIREAYEKSGQVAVEALENPRTVAALGREDYFCDSYEAQLAEPERKAARATLVHALGAAIQQLSQMWLTALAFWYGGKLVADPDENLDFAGLMRSQSSITFAAQSIGQLSAQFPDFGKAIAAANSIFELLDRKPAIAPPNDLMPARPGESDEEANRRAAILACADPEAPSVVSGGLVGDIEFSDVYFTYPTRPGAPVLQGLNLRIRPRTTVALVGRSGCGKSTVISMLERMYAPDSGTVFVDGRPIDSLGVAWLRSQMGLVGQEPVLFAGTILENIRHGKPDATLEEVVEAAKLANAHSFISSFPDTYGTRVGEKGVALSGGQKQRIAIARALVRNPKILLLDEATSALDTASEAVVQEALDRARDGRTTIVIAHRLSTVVGADAIAVVDQGRVVEYGSHKELLALGGLYYSLVAQQSGHSHE
eukprot:m51a1_g521 hypothetical protein (1324) ;mRNA; r:334642-338749